MAIIRDEKGNVYNIPEQELKKYLVVKAGKSRPSTLCLEPMFDPERGPHDGWSYATSVGPTKKATEKVTRAVAKTPAKKTSK